MTMEQTLKKVKEQVANKYNSKCPGCGISFNCEVKAGKGTCWCFNAASNRNLGTTGHQDCFCKVCLLKK